MGRRLWLCLGLVTLMSFSGVAGWRHGGGRMATTGRPPGPPLREGRPVPPAPAPPPPTQWRWPQPDRSLPAATPDYTGFLAPAVPQLNCQSDRFSTQLLLEGVGAVAPVPRLLPQVNWTDLGVDVRALLRGDEAELLKAVAVYLELPAAERPSTLERAGLPVRTLLTTGRGRVIQTHCALVYSIERQQQGWQVQRLSRFGREGIRVADLTGDGRPEVILDWNRGSGGIQGLEVWMDRGGRLQSVLNMDGVFNGSLVVADMESDGVPELILTGTREARPAPGEVEITERFVHKWSFGAFRQIHHHRLQALPDGLAAPGAAGGTPAPAPQWWLSSGPPPPATPPNVEMATQMPLVPEWQPPQVPIAAALPEATPELADVWRPPYPHLAPLPRATALGLPGVWGLDERLMFASGYPPHAVNTEVLRGIALWLGQPVANRPPAPNWAGIPGHVLAQVSGSQALVQVERTGGLFWLAHTPAGWRATPVFTHLPEQREVWVDDLDGDSHPEVVVAAVYAPHRRLQVDVLSVTPAGLRPVWRSAALTEGAWRPGEKRADGTRDLILDQAGAGGVLADVPWEPPLMRERFVLRWQRGTLVLHRHLRHATPLYHVNRFLSLLAAGKEREALRHAEGGLTRTAIPERLLARVRAGERISLNGSFDPESFCMGLIGDTDLHDVQIGPSGRVAGFGGC